MNEKNIVDKFFELIDELYRNDVDYILIGGFAVILYGLPRTTGDMIWLSKTMLIILENLETH
jgi:hypothetical protein